MATKALLLGLDGLDGNLTESMIAEGLLPNFKALKVSSRRTAIQNYPGMGAGVFWASAACGVTPDYHGRYFHLQFDQRTYDVKPFEEHKNFKTPALWKTLDKQGRKVAIIDWHRAPFQKISNGFFLDNWLGHDSTSDTRSYPPDMAAKTIEKYGGDPFAGGSWSRLLDSANAYAAYIEQACQRIQTKVQLACDQLTARNWDLYAPCFSEIHDVGHYVHHLSDTEHPLHDHKLREAIGDPLRSCYIAIDDAIGTIIEAAGPQAAIMVLAGPGMMGLVSANTAIEEIARRLDLGVGVPSTGAENAKLAYRSFIPVQLRWKIAPLARKLRQRFADSAYANRRFFGIPHNDNSACIRINVKGRERFGIIERGAQFDALVEEIREGLMAIVDADTGINIVENVVSIQHDYDGPYVDMLPDIFVEWNRGGALKAIHRIRSDKIGEMEVEQSRRTGDHTATGFFMARGVDGAVFNAPGLHYPHEVTEIIQRAAGADGAVTTAA